MYCQNCGSKIELDSLFCSVCGTRLNTKKEQAAPVSFAPPVPRTAATTPETSEKLQTKVEFSPPIRPFQPSQQKYRRLYHHPRHSSNAGLVIFGIIAFCVVLGLILSVTIRSGSFGHVMGDFGTTMGDFGTKMGELGENLGEIGDRLGDAFGTMGDRIGDAFSGAFNHTPMFSLMFVILFGFFVFGFFLCIVVLATRNRRPPSNYYR